MSAALAMMGAGEHLGGGEKGTGNSRGEEAIGRKRARNAEVSRKKIRSGDLAPGSAEPPSWRRGGFGRVSGRGAAEGANDFDGLIELGRFVEKLFRAELETIVSGARLGEVCCYDPAR